jgi:hypothetical protein
LEETAWRSVPTMGRGSIDFAIGSNRRCKGTLVRRRM